MGMRAVDLADAFGATAKLLGRSLTEQLESHGESMPRFRLLVELVRHGPMRLTELANRVGTSQGPTSALVEALVVDGLVERTSDSTDMRATRLAATRHGEKRAEAWLNDYEAAAADIFSALPKRQWPQLKAMLDTLSAHAVRPESR